MFVLKRKYDALKKDYKKMELSYNKLSFIKHKMEEVFKSEEGLSERYCSMDWNEKYKEITKMQEEFDRNKYTEFFTMLKNLLK